MASAIVPLGEMNGPSDGGGKKRLSVERIYQKKSQLEHILLRPDTYIGSVEEVTQSMWVFEEGKGFVQRQISYVPGLYKIFDEILVNAADNKQRDPSMNKIEIDIDAENNQIRVWNNGHGIPVETHKVEKKLVPTMIFGELLTSSNYDDTQKKVTGGRNGYGAKLCNIFCTKFTVETACANSGKKYKQSWKNNMSSCNEPDIKPFSGRDFTCVTFKPDLSKFSMERLDRDIVALMTRRAYDVAGSSNGVKVFLNGKLLPIRSFREYVNLYLKNSENPLGDDGERTPDQVVYEKVNTRWEVCVTPSASGFQQVSFVNSIATTKGGSHIDYVTKQLVDKLMTAAKRKNKGGADMKPHLVKSHLWVFINCLVENPAFDSQTKENMTLKVKSFGSECALSEKFVKKVTQCGVVDLLVTSAQAKLQAQLSRKAGSTGRQTKLKGIPKLDDAGSAGGKKSRDCTLILTEGDSAKTLAVSGLSVVGRDLYGVFPLRGKVLNVREASAKQMTENAEITNIVKIMGLKYGKKYMSESDLASLRYGHLMVMTDQDQDGSHIKGLLINFIHYNWPSLLRLPFMEQFITPIVKVSKGREEIPFYSMPEFEQWKESTPSHRSWKVKYYKGLGTSTSKEGKEYFQDMERHRILFKYAGAADDDSIKLAFSKSEVDARKRWLDAWLQNRRERRCQGLNESFLYGLETDAVSYSEFVNKELVQFSNADNERSIPSIVDGLKPGQRKVLFTCFKRNDKREIKVAQLAGSVAELSAYHHGETSLMSTIINLAQNFVGSNNLNLLQPIGQFGTRLHGGKDAASPRYIFTMLSPLARVLFPAVDDNCLEFLTEDNMRIEPEWYCPVIPMVLVNGSEGIGTGYSSMVPNYDVREIVANLRRMLREEEPVDMSPSYKGFTGTIAQIEPTKYAVYGTIARLDDKQVEITELPVRSWTQTYKEKVIEPMLYGTEKTQAGITDYLEYHTDTTVRFVATLTRTMAVECDKVGYHKKFKLEGSIATSNLVLFDHNGCLKKYNDVLEILTEFFAVRLDMYERRKTWLEGQLSAESLKLDNQARFIMEKIEGKIVLEDKKKKDIVLQLKTRGYDSDPVKAWKEQQSSHVESSGENEEDEEETQTSSNEPDYAYLLHMSLLSLTREKKEELLANKQAKAEELHILKSKTSKDLWNEDLDHFMQELEKVEKEEQENAMISVSGTSSRAGKKGGKKGRGGRSQPKPKLTSSGVVAESLPQAPPEDVIPPVIPQMGEKKEKATKRKRKTSSDSTEGTDKSKADGNDKARGQRSLEDFFSLDDLNNEQKPASKAEKPPKPDIIDVDDSSKGEAIKSLSERLATKQAPKKQAASKPKPGKKPKPKSTFELVDDSDDDIVEQFSTDQSSSDVDEPVAKRPAVSSRRAAAVGKKVYTFSDHEDDESSDDDVIPDSESESGEDFAATKAPAKSTASGKGAEGKVAEKQQQSRGPDDKQTDDVNGKEERVDKGKVAVAVRPDAKKKTEAIKKDAKPVKKRTLVQSKTQTKSAKPSKQPTMAEAMSKAQGQKRKEKQPLITIDSEDENATFDQILSTKATLSVKPVQGPTTKAIQTVKSPAKVSKSKDAAPPRKRVKAMPDISSDDEQDDVPLAPVVQRKKRAQTKTLTYTAESDASDDDDDDEDFMV